MSGAKLKSPSHAKFTEFYCLSSTFQAWYNCHLQSQYNNRNSGTNVGGRGGWEYMPRPILEK